MSAASDKGRMLQAQIARFLKERMPDDAFWSASMTGVWLGPGARMQAKAQGVRKGVPDFLVVTPDHPCLWMEAKAGTSDLTTEQRAFRNLCKPFGNWAVVRSVADAETALIGWGVKLKRDPFAPPVR